MERVERGGVVTDYDVLKTDSPRNGPNVCDFFDEKQGYYCSTAWELVI